MPGYTERFSEVHELLGAIDPASYSSEQNTGYLNCENYNRVVIEVITGVCGQDVDIDIEEGTSAAGAGAQTFDSGGKDITITATTDNNGTAIIEIRGEEFTDGFSFLNVEATPAGASSIFGVQVWGFCPRCAEVSTAGLISVTD